MTRQPADTTAQIDGFLAKYSPEISAQLRAARQQWRRLFPRGFELVYDSYNALVFGFGSEPSASGAIVSIAGYPKWVTLFFLHGASLPDPNGILEGRGVQVRSVRLSPPSRLQEPAAQALIAAAKAENPELRSAPTLTTLIKSVSAKQRPRRSPMAKKAKSPVLLAGGNPQIPKGDGRAPVRAYIEAIPGWKRDVGRRIDAIVTREVPRVRKAVKWNSLFYGMEDQGWFLNVHCFTKYVKVAFFNGASLKPMPPGLSKDTKVRYLDIHEDSGLDLRQFVAWVRQASKLPGWDAAAGRERRR